MVQLVWLVRVMRTGSISGCASSSVSALCVQASWGSIAAVQGQPPYQATSVSPTKILTAACSKTIR